MRYRTPRLRTFQLAGRPGLLFADQGRLAGSRWLPGKDFGRRPQAEGWMLGTRENVVETLAKPCRPVGRGLSILLSRAAECRAGRQAGSAGRAKDAAEAWNSFLGPARIIPARHAGPSSENLTPQGVVSRLKGHVESARNGPETGVCDPLFFAVDGRGDFFGRTGAIRPGGCDGNVS